VSLRKSTIFMIGLARYREVGNRTKNLSTEAV
jgi:hypothetical protein